MKPRGLPAVLAAVLLAGCGTAAPTAAPSSPASTPTASPSTSTSEVTSEHAPWTYLLVKGYDAAHTTAGEPGVPWLWDGAINRPDGSQVPTNLHGGGRPLSFAGMPGHPNSYYVLRDGQGSPGQWLEVVNKSDVQGQTGMGADDPGWSTSGGLVSNADDSMVAYATADQLPAGDNGIPWQVTLVNDAGSRTWTVPHGMTPDLVGVGASGAVVMNVSGSFSKDILPILVAEPDGSMQPLPRPSGPPGAEGYRAASVSPSGTQVTVTFTEDGELKSCWGVADIEDGTMSRYTCDGGVDPTFSPDGREIATLGWIDVAVPHESNTATIYDSETLQATKVFTTASPGAHGGWISFFGPALTWDHGSLLAPVYNDANGQDEGWMLAWLTPSAKPDYQYARSLLVPAKEKDPPPFAFSADSLRATG